jgi:ribosomal protein L31
MKSGTHPDYHMINVEMITAPSSRPVRLGKEGDTPHLDIDPSPPGLTGGHRSSTLATGGAL